MNPMKRKKILRAKLAAERMQALQTKETVVQSVYSKEEKIENILNTKIENKIEDTKVVKEELKEEVKVEDNKELVEPVKEETKQELVEEVKDSKKKKKVLP